MFSLYISNLLTLGGGVIVSAIEQRNGDYVFWIMSFISMSALLIVFYSQGFLEMIVTVRDNTRLMFVSQLVKNIKYENNDL